MKIKILIIILFVCPVTNVATAQDAKQTALLAIDSISRHSVDPTQESGAGKQLSSILFSKDSKNEIATGKFVYDFNDPSNATNSGLSLLISAPLQKDTTTNLFSSSGLVKNGKVELSYHFTGWTTPTTDAVDDMGTFLTFVINNINSDSAKSTTFTKLNSIRLSDLSKYGYSKQFADAFLNKFGDAFTFAASFSAVNNDIDYAKDSSLIKATFQTVTMGGKIGAGYISHNWMFAVTGQYNHLYNPQPTQTFLEPFGSSNGILVSKSISFGKPKETDLYDVLLETRFVQENGEGTVGINPRVTFFQLNSDAIQELIELPIYFSSKGAPNGGIVGSWESDTHAFLFSVFVGAALDLSL